MAAVVVAGRKPLYEMGAADLVVKQLDELSFKGLKKLFDMEGLVEPQVREGCSICCGNAVLAYHHPHISPHIGLLARHGDSACWCQSRPISVFKSYLQAEQRLASVWESCAWPACRACSEPPAG